MTRRDIINALTRFAEDLTKELAVKFTGDIVPATPVDTGWTRSNWVPSIGTPHTEIVGSKEHVDTGVQVNALRQVALSRYTLSDGIIYVRNNTPSIEPLNNGSSQQAPSKFVERTIFRTVREVSARSETQDSQAAIRQRLSEALANVSR